MANSDTARDITIAIVNKLTAIGKPSLDEYADIKWIAHSYKIILDAINSPKLKEE